MTDAPDEPVAEPVAEPDEGPALARVAARLGGVAVVAGVAGGLIGARLTRLEPETIVCGAFLAAVAASAQGAEEIAPRIASRWLRAAAAFGLGLAGAALGLLAASSVEDLFVGHFAPGGQLAARATESGETAGILAAVCVAAATVVCGHAIARDLARGRRLEERFAAHVVGALLAGFLVGVETGVAVAAVGAKPGPPAGSFYAFDAASYVAPGFLAASAFGALLCVLVGPAAALVDWLTRSRAAPTAARSR